jgi:terminase small subunit / prophage DNA-packing protein
VLAALFKLDERTIRKLAEARIMVRVGRGRYNAAASTSNYVVHLRELAAGRGSPDVAAANSELKNVQTKLLQLRLEKERGELIPVSNAREVWSAIVRGTRQAVLGLPGKIAFEVPTLSIHDRGTIERLVRDTLEDMAMGRGFELGQGGSERDGEDS